jgi:hypothetical protein
MKEFKIRITVLDDGKILIENLPVKVGQQVEVTVRIDDVPGLSFPLRGRPVRFHEPFLPAVPDEDWDVLK